jgi:hypothetical protein
VLNYKENHGFKRGNMGQPEGEGLKVCFGSSLRLENTDETHDFALKPIKKPLDLSWERRKISPRIEKESHPYRYQF